SLTQLCIYDGERPWYFFKEGTEEAKRTESILNSIMQSEEPLIESTIFCEMLNWAINEINNTDSPAFGVFELITETAVHKKQELELLIHNTTNYLDSIIDFNSVKKLIENNELYVNTVKAGGDPLLISAARAEQFELLEKLIQKGADLHIRDKKGNTLLHHLANQPKALKYLLG